MKKNILYVGGFNFNTTNASSIRVIENARFLKKLNFNVEVLGKISSTRFINEIKVSNIVTEEENFSRNISIIEFKVKSLKINYIIAYNYPPIAFYKLIKFCKVNNIILIPDLTEWYGIDGGFTLDKGVRFVLHQWRMYVLNNKCDYKIVASSYLDAKYKGSNNLKLPFVTIENSKFEDISNLVIQNLSFVYAGSPGNNFSKDRLDIVLKAFAKVKEKHTNFSLKVIGLTYESLLEITSVKKDVVALNENLTCYGRMPNEACVEIIKQTNFIVFSRDVKRVTSAGFPTKVFEAFKYGLPVLTNKTSDISTYVTEKNGFLVELADVDEFSEKIETILSSDTLTLQTIINNCRTKNPFFYDNFKEQTLFFFKEMNR